MRLTISTVEGCDRTKGFRTSGVIGSKIVGMEGVYPHRSSIGLSFPFAWTLSVSNPKVKHAGVWVVIKMA